MNSYVSMKSLILSLVSILLLVTACDKTTETISLSIDHNISVLPFPKKLAASDDALLLGRHSRLYSSSREVEPLLSIFQDEIHLLTEVNINLSENKNSSADIIFEINPELSKDEYELTIDQSVYLSAGSYQALAMGKATLLQLMYTQDDLLVFPKLTINDRPDANYRGLMIDLARQWHSLETVKKLIDLAAFYKSNYIHLHFTDYQSYTLPSKSFPKLSTQDRTYSFEELEELEAYSQQRGVTIIPEIDIPGHSSPFIEKYPEIFAIKDISENPWIVNMGKEEVYTALETIIGEASEIFKSTPYFHIGGDEAIFHKVMDDPDVQAYMKEHELGNDVHELYRHFLVRMRDIIHKYDKKMAVWEGFRRDGEVVIPKDIIVFEYETNRYLPNHLVEDGYTVVNTSWKPLYVVNRKKWEPKTIYEWNIWRWENWFPKAPSIIPIQLEKTPLIIGAQMCAWEQAEETEIPSIRKRLPAMNERIWNTELTRSYEDFMKAMDETDRRLSLLINDSRQDSLLVNYNFVNEETGN